MLTLSDETYTHTQIDALSMALEGRKPKTLRSSGRSMLHLEGPAPSPAAPSPQCSHTPSAMTHETNTTRWRQPLECGWEVEPLPEISPISIRARKVLTLIYLSSLLLFHRPALATAVIMFI